MQGMSAKSARRPRHTRHAALLLLLLLLLALALGALACKERFGAEGFQAHIPPAVAYRPLLSALAAAIE